MSLLSGLALFRITATLLLIEIVLHESRLMEAALACLLFLLYFAWKQNATRRIRREMADELLRRMIDQAPSPKHIPTESLRVITLDDRPR